MENKKDSSQFLKVGNYAFPPEAEMMASVLKKQGIPVLLQSESSGIFGSSAVPSPAGVSLLVPENNFKTAKDILDNICL